MYLSTPALNANSLSLTCIRIYIHTRIMFPLQGKFDHDDDCIADNHVFIKLSSPLDVCSHVWPKPHIKTFPTAYIDNVR